MKKVLSIFMAAVILFSLCIISSAAVADSAPSFKDEVKWIDSLNQMGGGISAAVYGVTRAQMKFWDFKDPTDPQYVAKDLFEAEVNKYTVFSDTLMSEKDVKYHAEFDAERQQYAIHALSASGGMEPIRRYLGCTDAGNGDYTVYFQNYDAETGIASDSGIRYQVHVTEEGYVQLLAAGTAYEPADLPQKFDPTPGEDSTPDIDIPEPLPSVPDESETDDPIETPDSIPPVLNSVSVDKSEVQAPGTFKVTLDISDDVSGISYIFFILDNRQNDHQIQKEILVTEENVRNGKFEVTIDISEFEPSGIFIPSMIYISDNANNEVAYYESDPTFPIPGDVSVLVKNSDWQDDGEKIITSTTNSDLKDNLAAMEEGRTADIYYGNESNVQKDIFDSIKGQDKTVSFKSRDIEWNFNGKDIKDNNVKDIDLKTEITLNTQSGSENTEDINKQLKDQNAIILSFADNGVLPAPAQIRMKMDYGFKDAVGTDDLYVYYYDNTNHEFVKIAENLKITEDGYLEFTITHNSDYVVRKGAMPAPEPAEPDPTVPETTVPETTVPETTVPETTVPETTVPETTVPETTVPETTVPAPAKPDSVTPQTGDSSHLIAWSLVGVLAAACAAALIVMKKKKHA